MEHLRSSYVGKDPSGLLTDLAIVSSAISARDSYYSILIRSDDEFTRVAATCALIDLGKVSLRDWEVIRQRLTYFAVQRRAFDWLFKESAFPEAHQVAGCRPEVRFSDQLYMNAKVGNDFQVLADQSGNRFLDTGELKYLNEAAQHAEAAGGWTAALPWLIRTVVALPLLKSECFRLLDVLYNANQGDLVETVISIIYPLHPDLSDLYRSRLLLDNGRADDAVAIARQYSTNKYPPARNLALRTVADSLEKIGDYRKSYFTRKKLNELTAERKIDPRIFYVNVEKRNSLEFEQLPPDSHAETFMMLGFPRSGTTLLENILASHPLIETFEELSFIPCITRFIDAWSPSGQKVSANLAVGARDRYYRYMEMVKKKQAATVFIDKLPIRSSQAALLRKLFPEKRYIFAIRHPFDVCVSCFRQNFSPNIAMENFITFDGACRLYDFTMKNWFSNFDLSSGEVCYVSYEDILFKFDKSVGRVIKFLGLEWDNSVREFASRASERANKTPSYRKVRQGLGLGIQSYQESHRFLRREPGYELLRPWMAHFGYDEL